MVAAMLIWAYERSVTLRLIEPDRPNQNAYIELFNGRLRDARIQRGTTEEKSGGLKPSAYAQQLAARAATMPRAPKPTATRSGGRLSKSD